MILLVEDHADTRHIMVRILMTKGHEVESVGSAEEALTFLKTKRPSVILADYKLPGMDGVKLFRTIRRNPEWQDIRFIILSAYDSVEGMSMAAGVDAFVDKCGLKIKGLLESLAEIDVEATR